MLIRTTHIPVPCPDGDYRCIYRPAGDVYSGIDTEHYKYGAYYPEWIVNDFSVLHADGTWHLTGITHPRPAGFVSAFEFDEKYVHEAEYQLFHATARGGRFCDVFREGAFRDEGKLLYPQQRPGERPELWAPQLLRHEGRFHIVYSPGSIRHAASDDFVRWTILPPLFECEDPTARDPYITQVDGTYYLTYTSSGSVLLRTSEDLIRWSDPVPVSRSLAEETDPESSVLFRREGIWYLMWSAYDGRNGCYDERCFVFAARTPAGLYGTTPVAMLRAHAPEIVRDEDGQDYLLSVYYPENGVSAVRLKWV